MAQQIMLTNPLVNGGIAVEFNGATLQYVWKSLTRADPLTNSFTVNEAQTAGFENPRMSITGFVNTDDSGINIVTQSLLQDFASVPYDGTSATATTLSVSTGITNTFVKNYNNTNDNVRVIIDSFNMTVDAADSKLGHFWRYSLQLIETK